MPSSSLPNLLLGTASFGPDVASVTFAHNTPAKVAVILDTWKAVGGNRIDTAEYYGMSQEEGPGGSERKIGEYEENFGKEFMIDTKIFPRDHGAGKCRKYLEGSLKDLKVDSVNIVYLHAPDRVTPFFDVIRDMDELFKEGKFKAWGLSNYTVDEVKEFLDLAKQHNLAPPKAYQGNYSLICRRGEGSGLFTLLKENGMSFNAYSPLAMGMLVGGPKKESLEAALDMPPGTRFHPEGRKGTELQKIWFKPAIFDSIKELNKISSESGIDPIALSLRWLAHHSALDATDGIILGTSSAEQLRTTVGAISGGPLPQDVADKMENVSKIAYEDSPPYSM